MLDPKNDFCNQKIILLCTPCYLSISQVLVLIEAGRSHVIRVRLRPNRTGTMAFKINGKGSYGAHTVSKSDGVGVSKEIVWMSDVDVF